MTAKLDFLLTHPDLVSVFLWSQHSKRLNFTWSSGAMLALMMNSKPKQIKVKVAFHWASKLKE